VCDGAAVAASAAVTAPKVITRCNLIILTETGFEDLPAFWAERGVEVTASLPSWEARNYERQRGAGLFERALAGLRMLNEAGYGTGALNAAGQPLALNLVVNPGGAFLPPSQASAEREFKEHLGAFGLSFDHLLTITNNPTGRFAAFLAEKGTLDAYLKRLADAFNPATVANMMCRSQISVRWDGVLYDCDFNQAAELPIEGANGQPLTIADIAHTFKANSNPAAAAHPPDDDPASAATTPPTAATLPAIYSRAIRLDNHCYACCAGAGSSCGGATA
jgi:radical SAM/Cys-rich protein